MVPARFCLAPPRSHEVVEREVVNHSLRIHRCGQKLPKLLPNRGIADAVTQFVLPELPLKTQDQRRPVDRAHAAPLAGSRTKLQNDQEEAVLACADPTIQRGREGGAIAHVGDNDGPTPRRPSLPSTPQSPIKAPMTATCSTEPLDAESPAQCRKWRARVAARNQSQTSLE